MKKFILFIAAVWTTIILMLGASPLEVITNAIVFVICLYSFTEMHFNETKRYPKSIGVIYYLAILSSLVVSVEFNSVLPSIFYNVMLTIVFYIIYQNTKSNLFESKESRFGYVIATIVFTALIIFSTIYGNDSEKILFFILSYASIIFLLVLSLGTGRYFIENSVLIKGSYSYHIVGICSIFYGLVSFCLIGVYLEGLVTPLKFVLYHLPVVGFYTIVFLIYEKSIKNKIKYKFCPICKTPNHLEDKECYTCGIELDKSYPICPNCGNPLESIFAQNCHHCKFRLDKYFNKNMIDDKFCLLNIVSREDDSFHNLLVTEGMFVSNYTKILTPKIGVFDEINIYGESWKSESTEKPIYGLIHLYRENKKFAWCVYSPEILSNTHKDFKIKKEKEEKDKKRREAEAEIEIELQEEERIRKENEEKELIKKREEEAKLVKQEHARKVSEQTGIILD